MAELSTYQDIVDTVRSLIKDPVGAQRLATSDQIDIWANSSMAEMAEHAEYIDEVRTTNTAAGTSSIAIAEPPTYIGLWRVEIDNEAIFPITTRNLYKSSRTWQAQTGEPRFYYLDSRQLVSYSGTSVGLWPKASGVFAVRLYFKAMADALDYATPTDKVMLPLWATPGLVWGILSKFYESESRMQNLQSSQFYRMLFDQVTTRLRARSFSRLPRSVSWGENSGGRLSNDLHNLMPADGFPYTP